MANSQKNQFQLEQFLLGELSTQEMSNMVTAIKTDPTLALRLKELKRSNKEILGRYPKQKIADEINQRLRIQAAVPQSRRWHFTPAMVAGPLLATVLIAAFLILPKNSPQGAITDLTGPDITTSKGNNPDTSHPQLLIYHKKSPQMITEVTPGSKLKVGDLLQIAYIPAKSQFGVIFSIDGKGAVTLHHPETEGQTNQLTPSAKQILLSTAYELDNAPDFERFFFITCAHGFSTRSIIDKAQTLANGPGKISELLPLGNDFAQYTLLVKK